MSRYLNKYNIMQSRLEPEEEAVKKAVSMAHGTSDGSKRTGQRKKAAFCPLLTSRLAAAAAAVLCVCVTVPVIAGVALNEINKKTRVEQYVDTHNVSSEYVQYPEFSVKLKNADVKVERYVKVNDNVIIDIRMTNTNDKPGEKYSYSMFFYDAEANNENISKFPDKTGVKDIFLDFYEISTEYDAETNSVLKSYLIENRPDKLKIVPVTGDTLMYKNNERDAAENGRSMVLDLTAAPAFISENDGISIAFSEEDIKKCIEKTPIEDRYEYKIVPFRLTFSDFGIIRQMNAKEAAVYTGLGYKWPWTPSRIVIEYKNEEKTIFISRMMDDIVPKDERTGIKLEEYNYLNGFWGYAAGDGIDENKIYTQYVSVKNPIDISQIKSIYVDGVEFKVN